MGPATRVARTAVLAAALCAGGHAASAADTPAKPGDAPKLALHLAPGTTYLYRHTEITRARNVFDGQPDADQERRLTFESQTIWEFGLSLSETAPDGTLLVSLMPTRLQSSFEEPTGVTLSSAGVPEITKRTRSFDSDDPKVRTLSPFVGRVVRLKLSPAGRILEAIAPDRLDLTKLAPEDREKVSRLIPDMGKPFAQRFLQELAADAAATSLAWETSRPLAFERTGFEGAVSQMTFGDVAERATVTKAGPALVTATLLSSGKKEIARLKEPALVPEDFEKRMELLRPQLEDWLVTGEVAIRRATGLPESRTTRVRITAHTNPVKLPKGIDPNNGGIPFNAPLGEMTTSGHDTIWEIETKLEALPAR